MADAKEQCLSKLWKNVANVRKADLCYSPRLCIDLVTKVC